MEMPVRFYRYRYQDYWEAELPVEWIVRDLGNGISFAAKNPGGEIFSVWTKSQADFEKDQDKAHPVTVKDWRLVTSLYKTLDEEDTLREPDMECGLWNKDFEAWFRIRNWRFRGGDFLISVMHDTKAKRIDSVHDSIVDRFVRTLSLVER
ncbi:MAG TPA: hypothetical protein VGH19_19820 [Verrucomicrobiae bacterium]